MATLKTFALTPAQISALQSLATSNPNAYAMPVNDGKANRLEFQIEKTPEVHATLAAAGRKPDPCYFDFSDDVIEFDGSYSYENDSFIVRKLEVQLEDCTLSIYDTCLGWEETDRILIQAGFAEPFNHADLYEEHRSDIQAAFTLHILLENAESLKAEQPKLVRRFPWEILPAEAA